MNKRKLKETLDGLYDRYKNKHSSKDPVWILHRFQDNKDIEVIGFITSCYSYGQVDGINTFMNKFLKNIGFKVHEFTVNFSQQKDKKFLKDLYYRFNSAEDLITLISNIKNIIKEHGSLLNLFAKSYDNSHNNILTALTAFTHQLNKHSKNGSYKYLIPSPEKNSTCKRLHLYLRWMVRSDEIDLGLWKNKIDKSKLLMPVDTHVYRISRKLKIVKRASCDVKFVISLTEALKQFDELDPVKYDFAMCHLGIDGRLNTRLNQDNDSEKYIIKSWNEPAKYGQHKSILK